MHAVPWNRASIVLTMSNMKRYKIQMYVFLPFRECLFVCCVYLMVETHTQRETRERERAREVYMQKEKSVQSASALADSFSGLFYDLTFLFFRYPKWFVGFIDTFIFIYVENYVRTLFSGHHHLICTPLQCVSVRVCICGKRFIDIYYRCCSLLFFSRSHLYLFDLCVHILLKCSRFLVLGKRKKSAARNLEGKKRYDDQLLPLRCDERLLWIAIDPKLKS